MEPITFLNRRLLGCPKLMGGGLLPESGSQRLSADSLSRVRLLYFGLSRSWRHGPLRVRRLEGHDLVDRRKHAVRVRHVDVLERVRERRVESAHADDWAAQ